MGRVAIKMMDKARLRQLKAPPDMVANEVDMMRECNGGKELFVQLYDFIETTTKFCLVLEYFGNGTLQDAVLGTVGFLGEVQVRSLMQQVLEAISYLHTRNICHRDIKPHNFMMSFDEPACLSGQNGYLPLQAQRSVSSEIVPLLPQRSTSSENWHGHGGEASLSMNGRSTSAQSVESPSMRRVKLGDFGTATRVMPSKLVRNKVGTPAFMAPEMHLLPGRSPGYDLKVDVWAAGVVMVFLLANEYPFIDVAGRLLRHKLVQGDVPLWETGTFQDMFIGFQEAVGMRKKRPSKLARDLALHLLTPSRQLRATAGSALRHAWFRLPVVVEGTDAEVAPSPASAKLLDWKDFEAGLSVFGRDLQWAMDMMTGTLGNTVDDPLKTCVVCYSPAGGVGYICPQCHHAVCVQCIDQLPKPQCPFCRHEAHDMPRKSSGLQAQRESSGGQRLESLACVHGNSANGLDKPRPLTVNVRGVMPV